MNIFKTRFTIMLSLILLCTNAAVAQLIDDSAAQRQQAIRNYVDSVDNSIGYQQGKIPLKEIAELNVIKTYKFIPAEKAQMILSEFWGNPKDADVMGMIVRSDYKISDTAAWAFVVTYQEDGYVKDDDANKIDYDDLMKDMQKDEVEVNEARVKEGYPEVHLLGWAAKPFYDKEKKVLHWAKELKFSDNTSSTLNYDVRVLGRKGILSLKAVGSMDQLNDINRNIPLILSMATFTEPNQYSKFNPSVDKIAAYTIGGLIAGKLIAKTGLLILLAKNIKLILFGLLGGFSAFRKRIAGWFSRKKKDTSAGAPPSDLPVNTVAEIEAPATAADVTITKEDQV